MIHKLSLNEKTWAPTQLVHTAVGAVPPRQAQLAQHQRPEPRRRRRRQVALCRLGEVECGLKDLIVCDINFYRNFI